MKDDKWITTELTMIVAMYDAAGGVDGDVHPGAVAHEGVHAG